MSIRTDSGVCKYCGVVLELALLRRIDDPGSRQAPAVDDYVCPDCDDEVEDTAGVA